MVTAHRSLMRPDQPSFEERRHPMNPWQQSGCRLVSFCQIYDLVLVSQTRDPVITSPPIRHDGAAKIGRFKNERLQTSSRRIGYSFQSNTPDLLVDSLSGNCYQCLAYSATASKAFFKSADERFIKFNGARQLVAPWPDHRPAQFVQHQPSRFVASQTKNPFQTKCTGTVFLTGNPPYCPKPHRQRDMRPMKNSSRCYRYTVTTLFTAIQIAKPDEFLKRTAGTDKALGPSKPKKVVPAILLVTIFSFKFHEIPRVFFTFHATKYNIW